MALKPNASKKSKARKKSGSGKKFKTGSKAKTKNRRVIRHPYSSIFLEGLQVSSAQIAGLSEGELDDLILQLLQAQAYKSGLPINQICVNGEGKAGDEGCDAWSGAPPIPDPWLGAAETCWQLKSGSAGMPARLKGEVLKPAPTETLKRGGRFVVIAAGSKGGVVAETNRLKTLIQEAKKKKISVSRIEVLGSERLAVWCNENPAIASRWAGHPNGLWTLDQWKNSEQHRVPWQSSPGVQSELDTKRGELDFKTGSVHHLHIQGPPGVGKTRFALELCLGASWSNSVVYIRQAADIRLTELIDSAVLNSNARLVIAADEVQANQLTPLRDSISRGNGNVRLITIGHCPTPDPTGIPSIFVKPLESQPMRQVVMGWHSAMPPEHVDFVVRFADGYVRLARLAADAVIRDPNLNVHQLLSRNEIRLFLDRMLDTSDRSALHVVAVLSSVGWEGDVEEEGQSIATHLGLDWKAVKRQVQAFQNSFGIAPQGGRYRYISPTPLGNLLAVEAWTANQTLLRSLLGILPDNAKEAYYNRLKEIASNPQAQEFARDQLDFFFRLVDFQDPQAVRRWSALSSADPDLAARNIWRALSSTSVSVSDRLQISGKARREIIWTLVRLAWQKSSFRDSIKALAFLAEAENESWSNNASGEFVARFQISLGGTALPYLDRLSILDELLESAPSLTGLVIAALSVVGNLQATRMDNGPASGQLPEKEWRANTWKEHFECVEAAIDRLRAIAKKGGQEIQSDLIASAQTLSSLLRNPPLIKAVGDLFNDIRLSYPETREGLRKIIWKFIDNEKKYGKSLSTEALEELSALHASFEDPSLTARLQQYVGEYQWEEVAQKDIAPLAKELLETKGALLQNWSWLSSGEANDSSRLGEALAAIDINAQLAETLPALPQGNDQRLISGYIGAKRLSLGIEWYEAWMSTQFQKVPRPTALLFEVAWRCGATESVVRILTAILQQERIDAHIVGRLEYGLWGIELAPELFEPLLRAMVLAGHSNVAIAILRHRIEHKVAEVRYWKPLALELVLMPELIRSEHMANYHWKRVATLLVGEFSTQVAKAIFEEQARDSSKHWFAMYSEASGILIACAKQSPNEVWKLLLPYFSSKRAAYILSIGFPEVLMEQFSSDVVLSWVREQPKENSKTIIRMIKLDFSDDQTLTSRILGKYGENEDLASAALSHYSSGGWMGPSSLHWEKLAQALDIVAKRTALPKLRRWAIDSSRHLRNVAERDRQREEEERLQRGW